MTPQEHQFAFMCVRRGQVRDHTAPGLGMIRKVALAPKKAENDLNDLCWDSQCGFPSLTRKERNGAQISPLEAWYQGQASRLAAEEPLVTPPPVSISASRLQSMDRRAASPSHCCEPCCPTEPEGPGSCVVGAFSLVVWLWKYAPSGSCLFFASVPSPLAWCVPQD